MSSSTPVMSSTLDAHSVARQIEVVDLTNHVREKTSPLVIVVVSVAVAAYCGRAVWRRLRIRSWKARQGIEMQQGPYRSGHNSAH